MISERLKKERMMTVYKSNDIVQRSRYKLDLLQQKTVAYLASKIKKDDTELGEVAVSTIDLCRVMGMEYCGQNTRNLKNAIRKLADKSMWITINEEEVLVRWLQKVRIKEGSGIVRCQFDPDMMPYLLKLHEQFISYDLINVLPMKSKYSLRLYEIMKSFCEMGKWEYKIDELRDKLCLGDMYKEYKALRRNVLDPAIEEINNFTDITVQYESKKEGKFYTSIKFYITDHSVKDNDYSRRKFNREKALGEKEGDVIPFVGQLSIEDVVSGNRNKKWLKDMRKLKSKYPMSKEEY